MQKNTLELANPAIPFNSAVITDRLFGANLLFNRDGSAKNGGISSNFEAFDSTVNLSNLRFPGGTVTEKYFEVISADLRGESASNIPLTSIQPLIRVSDFLSYASETGATTTVVLPTYRLLKKYPEFSGQREVDKSNETEMREFVRNLLVASQKAGATITTLEIGNEWYVDNSETFGFSMSPIEYGRVASYLTRLVEEELNEFEITTTNARFQKPNIAVQVGPGGNAEWYTPDGLRPDSAYIGALVSATELIYNEFTDQFAMDAVDGLIIHRYLHGTDAQVNGWAYIPFERWTQLAIADGNSYEFDRYVTEWNVSARNQTEIGVRQFDTMVALFEEMLSAGVDQANVWAVQQTNATRMIENTGLGQEPYGGLSFGGLAIDFMSKQLRGLQSFSLESNATEFTFTGFGSLEKMVLFISNKTADPQFEMFSFNSIVSDANQVVLYYVSVSETGLPVVSVSTFANAIILNELIISLGSYETVMIVVSRGQSGSRINGYSSSDVLSGGDFTDFISGEAGNDTLNGGTGNDTLDGGSGGDVLSGGFGFDTLFGAGGNDLLSGDGQADALYGDGGDDTLTGGQGFDIVSGGSGNDSLSGGTEEDWLFGGIDNDTVDGGSGNDFLFGGLGFDTIFGGDGNDQLNGEGQADALYGDAGNDTLFAGQGFDIVSGGTGNDQLFGGSEEDWMFGGLNDDTVDGGTGNDFLHGGLGNDSLNGGDGNDQLMGEGGTDRLTGGLGNDTFVFNSAIGGGVVDQIIDFNSVDDTIRLDDAFFAGLAGGALAMNAFVANATGLAASVSDRIIYRTDTGGLFFDADGAGGASSVQFASLSVGLTVISTDFFVF